MAIILQENYKNWKKSARIILKLGKLFYKKIYVIDKNVVYSVRIISKKNKIFFKKDKKICKKNS